MGILDGIVDWLATQVMNLLDLASTSVLGALGCNMDTFKRYFPAASAMYEIFIWTAIGLVLLNLVWQLYRCYGAGFDIDTENPINLVVRSVIFLLLIWYCDDIVNLALQIGGTPYNWILDSSLPGVQFGDFNSVLLVIIGVIANGSVALIALILVVILAWNYLKLLLEAAERYVVLGILVFTAPLAFAMGAARGTNNIFKSWCRMFGGQLLLLIMNAWCLKLFVNMVIEFLANPLSLLMRPAVKEILQDAEQHRFDVLLIGNRDSLCCDAADMESFLTVLNSFNIHIFAGGPGSWVEPNGRHYAPLPRLPWQEDDVAEVPQ